jgi:uncharacterized protein YbgA (DUF1722 family)
VYGEDLIVGERSIETMKPVIFSHSQYKVQALAYSEDAYRKGIMVEKVAVAKSIGTFIF